MHSTCRTLQKLFNNKIIQLVISCFTDCCSNINFVKMNSFISDHLPSKIAYRNFKCQFSIPLFCIMYYNKFLLLFYEHVMDYSTFTGYCFIAFICSLFHVINNSHYFFIVVSFVHYII